MLLLVIGTVISSPALDFAVSLLPLALSLLIIYSLLINKANLMLSITDCILICMVILSLLMHILFAPFLNITDAVKFYLIFFVFFVGKWSAMNNMEFYFNKHVYFAAFIVFPIALVIAFHFFPREDLSVLFFSNKNNAVAFCLISCLTLRAALPNIFTYYLYGLAFFWVVSFDTLGALLAFFAALLIINFRVSVKNIILATFVLVFFILLFSYSEIPIFERLRLVLSGLREFLAQFSFRDVAEVSYGEYAALQGGSNDVSLFFRLKQWLEIAFIIWDGSRVHIVTGYGMNASIVKTSIGLVPHNDWLRVFFELGVVAFLAFLLLNVRIFISLVKQDKYSTVIFLTVIIFMFSENLINNFLSMSLLYFSTAFILNRQEKINIKAHSGVNNE